MREVGMLIADVLLNRKDKENILRRVKYLTGKYPLY